MPLCVLCGYKTQTKDSFPEILLNNVSAQYTAAGLQIIRENNLLIEQVRQKYGINGCKFDWVTSLNNDGIEVDTSTMWDEDFTKINDFGDIYHHPNVKGSLQMFNQTLIDIPKYIKKYGYLTEKQR